MWHTTQCNGRTAQEVQNIKSVVKGGPYFAVLYNGPAAVQWTSGILCFFLSPRIEGHCLDVTWGSRAPWHNPGITSFITKPLFSQGGNVIFETYSQIQKQNPHPGFRRRAQKLPFSREIRLGWQATVKTDPPSWGGEGLLRQAPIASDTQVKRR